MPSPGCPGSPTSRSSALLFRSTGFQRNETELVILVTPRLVKPAHVDGGTVGADRPAGLPSDADLFLFARPEAPESGRSAPTPTSSPQEEPGAGDVLSEGQGGLSGTYRLHHRVRLKHADKTHSAGSSARRNTLFGVRPVHAYRQSGTAIPGFGNAIRQNAAVQIVDPQPAGAANTTIDMDGRRALLAIERYRTGTVVEPTELSTTEIVPFFTDDGGDGGGGDVEAQ